MWDSNPVSYTHLAYLKHGLNRTFLKDKDSVALEFFAKGNTTTDNGKQEGNHRNAQGRCSSRHCACAHGQHNEQVQHGKIDNTGDGVGQRIVRQSGAFQIGACFT